MRKLLFLFSFALLTSSSLLANGPSTIDANNPESLQEQLIKYLDDIDLSDVETTDKIYIDFMINAKGELMVFKTNNKELDSTIKSKLNYKKITNHNLESNKLYTLPISFKKD